MRVANANLRILFVAGFGPIVRETIESHKLYSDVMEIPFKEETGGYLHTEGLSGAKTFALWPLPQAALSCFGTETWPGNVPIPQAWLEFDVANVETATAELEFKGYKMLVKNKKEPWGQVVSRFLSPEGLLVGVTFTPIMRDSIGMQAHANAKEVGGMSKFLTIGYGDREGYDRTDAAVRDSAHAQDARLRESGALVAIAGTPIQVRNPDAAGVKTKTGPYMSSAQPIAGFAIIEAASLTEAVKIVSKTPCAVAHGVVEVWPLEQAE